MKCDLRMRCSDKVQDWLNEETEILVQQVHTERRCPRNSLIPGKARILGSSMWYHQTYKMHIPCQGSLNADAVGIT